MRLVATILTMALTLAFLGFVLTNPATVVAVKVWNTVHDGVPLWLVVLFAVGRVSSYNPSKTARNRSYTFFRRSFSDGVSSSPSTVRGSSTIANFLIVS